MELHTALEVEEIVNLNIIDVSLSHYAAHLRENIWSVDTWFHFHIWFLGSIIGWIIYKTGGHNNCTLHPPERRLCTVRCLKFVDVSYTSIKLVN